MQNFVTDVQDSSPDIQSCSNRQHRKNLFIILYNSLYWFNLCTITIYQKKILIFFNFFVFIFPFKNINSQSEINFSFYLFFTIIV